MCPRRVAVENLRDFLRISEAAEYLGVSPNTLRNWANAGKIAAHRHPVNGESDRFSNQTTPER